MFLITATSRMISENTITQLSALTYRADAKRRVCWIPLGGICWDDEMPDVYQSIHFPEEDRDQMFRLFLLRTKIWKGVELSEDEQDFWDEARARMPSWALFHRISISEADLLAQEQAERDSARALEELFADADQVTITEKDGIQSFSATYDLTKEPTSTAKKQPWWKRLFPKGKMKWRQLR
jgi:hypothetical protein